MTTTVSITAGGACYPVEYTITPKDGNPTTGFVPGNYTLNNIFIPHGATFTINERYIPDGYIPVLPNT